MMRYVPSKGIDLRRAEANENIIINHTYPPSPPIIISHKVEEFRLQELYGEGLDDLAKFNSSTQHSIFQILRDKGLANRKHPAISKPAIKLLNIPASSTQLERHLVIGPMSTAPYETDLTFERTKKLLHVSHTPKFLYVPSDEY
ncbi:hypothetical protein PR048_005349 [Dryococelus australis]|uniref:Uncharacterized protein n=1 Tax=Dryococelus australis TaxID=614101 RepID=A0ABQ9I7Y6_9NEOP|nr:hypothetical protein PR048_005349 [Dryococelus australis]